MMQKIFNQKRRNYRESVKKALKIKSDMKDLIMTSRSYKGSRSQN